MPWRLKCLTLFLRLLRPIVLRKSQYFLQEATHQLLDSLINGSICSSSGSLREVK